LNADARRLRSWIDRARPDSRALVRAEIGGVLAALSGVALFVGANALLVEAARRPGLRSVAGLLIVIELLAFLRSPIRFNERISSHRLGFRAVSQWRRWLVATVANWDYSRWRRYASGDLLERALRDTDELQDLWLRAVIPAASTIATLVIGDVAIGLLPSSGTWWTVAAACVLVQLGSLALLAGLFTPAMRIQRTLRRARGAYRAALVELSAVTPELALLGFRDFVATRAEDPTRDLAGAERALRDHQSLARGVAVVAPLASLGLIAAWAPASSPVWRVVAGLIILATFESFHTLVTALETAVAVSGAAERLDQMADDREVGQRAWPSDATIRVSGLRLREDDRVIVREANFDLAPGARVALTGPSGAGKSTLLRVLAALDRAESGSVSVGDVKLDEIDESSLRRHVVYVPAEPGLLRGYALDVVLMGRTTSRDVGADLARVGLDARADTRWDELSRGERQRVAMVRALVSDPDLLLLDEPTSGLGADETAEVLALLDSARATVLVATHDPQVMAWCSSVLTLNDGALSVLRR
jgi:ABC-type transport system involved in cytochrome bd biosynthesis fused ATPase/permease subunit